MYYLHDLHIGMKRMPPENVMPFPSTHLCDRAAQRFHHIGAIRPQSGGVLPAGSICWIRRARSRGAIHTPDIRVLRYWCSMRVQLGAVHALSGGNVLMGQLLRSCCLPDGSGGGYPGLLIVLCQG